MYTVSFNIELRVAPCAPSKATASQLPTTEGASSAPPHRPRPPSPRMPRYVAVTPIVNPRRAESLGRLWVMWFGPERSVRVYVWAGSAADAFETATKYLADERQSGLFTVLTESDYLEAAQELGMVWDPAIPNETVRDRAEADLWPVRWAALDRERFGGGAAFVSAAQWMGHEVEGAERDRVRRRSLAAVAEGDA